MTFVSRASARFWECYDALPKEIQQQADKQYKLFATNPFHPALRLKPVGEFWSVRVSLGYRALARRRSDQFYWFWIGRHDPYEKLIK